MVDVAQMPTSLPVPLVSVVLPAYNAQQFIASAVQSILDQTFTDFEFIIINDGSTDQTPAILHKFADRDSRIRLISRPNTGYVPALNEGLALARGKYIARMDADDLSLPARFEKQVAYLNANPDCVLIGTNTVQMDRDGDLIGPIPDIAFGHENINHDLLRRGWPIVHPAVMIRAAALSVAGTYRPEFCPNEDHDLFLRLGEIGRLENLPDVLLHYRRHDASESARKRETTLRVVTKIIIDACRRRGIPVPAEAQPRNIEPKSKTELHRQWAWSAIKHRNLSTARKYTLATLRHRPLALDSWRLTYCALRGR
jgi:glycosyltransferase involved in cell wall biosynthesis